MYQVRDGILHSQRQHVNIAATTKKFIKKFWKVKKWSNLVNLLEFCLLTSQGGGAAVPQTPVNPDNVYLGRVGNWS